ncbi:MAG: cytochrome c oxidase subunit II [Anaerolineae bacterium]|nr:cytochrome c oxidase subunit II [Anaerolineae bacterium]
MFNLDIPFLPEQASTISGKLDAFIFSLVGLSAFFALIVAILIVFFGVKYRFGNKEVDRTNPLDENTRLELGWSFVPLLISMVIFVWSAQVYFEIFTPPDDTLNLSVVGKQWMWKVQHPDGRREVNELHVPVGRPVKLTMTSQDVIHSFFIPAFRLKQDVLPGRFTTLWFEATRTGEFHLFCAEYCGTEHARMGGTVIVMDPAEYEEWLRTGNVDQVSNFNAASGEILFEQQGCATCHKLDGGQGFGPNLTGLFNTEVELSDGSTVVADEEYLRESIVNPQAKIVAGFPEIMPTYQNQLDAEELLEMVDYIKSLDGDETAALEN